jgi:hypothetical protein
MTIATLYAHFANKQDGAIGVMAGSRLSWRSGAYADTAVKTHELDRRTLAISAGLGIVGITAAELTRSILAQTYEHAKIFPGLWASVRVFTHFARMVRKELFCAHEDRDGPEVADNEFAIGGFYEDETPGIATIIMTKHENSVSFRRPYPGAELACTVIGDYSAKDIVYAAYLEAARREMDFHEYVASAFWYLISSQSESMRGIGGGLSIGICLQREGFRVMWPMVEVNGVKYYRGVPISSEESASASSIWNIDIDTTKAARLDRLVEDSKISGEPIGDRKLFSDTGIGRFQCSIDELLNVPAFQAAPEPSELQGIGLRYG